MLFADMLVVRRSFDIPIRRIIPTYQETAIVGLPVIGIFAFLAADERLSLTWSCEPSTNSNTARNRKDAPASSKLVIL